MAGKTEADDAPQDTARSREDAFATLTWAGPATLGGAIRFYDRDGKPLTAEDVANREAPEKLTGLSLSFVSRR